MVKGQYRIRLLDGCRFKETFVEIFGDAELNVMFDFASLTYLNGCDEPVNTFLVATEDFTAIEYEEFLRAVARDMGETVEDAEELILIQGFNIRADEAEVVRGDFDLLWEDAG